jgi:hypothetical protein
MTLSQQLRQLRAAASQGEWYVNNQEFESRLMGSDRVSFADFENPHDAYLAAFVANNAEQIIKALEAVEL